MEWARTEIMKRPTYQTSIGRKPGRKNTFKTIQTKMEEQHDEKYEIEVGGSESNLQQKPRGLVAVQHEMEGIIAVHFKNQINIWSSKKELAHGSADLDLLKR